MTDLMLIAVLLAAAASASWLLRDLRTVLRRGRHRDEAASVSVVIPARNEEVTLPTLLESLRRLAVGVADIVVVDDGSEDGTVSVARSAGAFVLDAGAPPPGWTGRAGPVTSARARAAGTCCCSSTPTRCCPRTHWTACWSCTT